MIAALPVAVVVLLCAWQMVLAGHAWWSVSEAARVAARAYAVNAEDSGVDVAREQARRAALRSLSSRLAKGGVVKADQRGRMRVTVRAPLVPPFSAVLRRGPAISARAGFGL